MGFNDYIEETMEDTLFLVTVIAFHPANIIPATCAQLIVFHSNHKIEEMHLDHK